MAKVIIDSDTEVDVTVKNNIYHDATEFVKNGAVEKLKDRNHYKKQGRSPVYTAQWIWDDNYRLDNVETGVFLGTFTSDEMGGFVELEAL